MSFAFIRTVRWPLLVRKKNQNWKNFFLSPWADIKKRHCFVPAGLVWEFVHLVFDTSTHHPVCLQYYCAIGQKFGGFAEIEQQWKVWKEPLSLLVRLTICTIKTRKWVTICGKKFGGVWKLSFSWKKKKKKIHFLCAPSACVSSSRCSFLPADAWLQLPHPFSFVSKQQILVGALGRWEIDPHPTAVAGTQTQLCSSTNWFWQRWELRFKPN